MKTKLLLFLILLFSIKYSQSQNVWVTSTNATVNDEITIYFDKGETSFWTDGEAQIYMYAGVNTSTGHWQNVNDAFASFDIEQEMTSHEGTKVWKKTITPKEYFSLSEGTTVYSIDLKFINQYAPGGNNETADLELVLTQANVFYTANDIVNFTVNGMPADITGNQISFQVDAETDIKNINPSISLSPQASVSPASGIAQDFTSPVSYTVTAENGDTRIYTASASQLSASKNINSFIVDGLEATISGTNISLELPYNTSSDLTKLTPNIVVSPLATITPASGLLRDFTNPLSYTVTAENNTTKTYQVSISIAAPPMVIVSPETPSADDEITITFNASGSALNNQSNVYIHCGVSCISGASQWIGNWGEDDGIAQMTATGKANQWQFVLTPTLDFADLLAGEDINQLEFLFRSADGTIKENNADNNYKQTLISAHVPDWIEISPKNPKINDNITLTFYPDKAPNKILKDAASIYMHSWAVTSGTAATSADFVGQANWADNNKGSLSEVSAGKWQINLNPATYFGIDNPNENLFRIGLIFRNETGSLVQKDAEDTDIYFEANPEFYIETIHPNSKEKSTEQNTDFDINFNLSENASFEIFADAISIFSSPNGTSHSMTHRFSELGKHSISIHANNGIISKEKTIDINIYSPVLSEALPEWIPANTKGIVYHKDDASKATLILHAPSQITYKDGKGTIYSTVDAPKKKVVHVLGDFNNWQVSENFKMKQTPDGNYYWLSLDNLEAGKEYVYQYLIDGNLQIADPYTEKVSDPDDKYISSTTYPDLIAYPADKAKGRASVLQTNQLDYSWSDSDFVMPAANDLNVYELHVRDFTTEGTYKAAKGKLDYIENMGINCIHLMPVSEFEGNDSWGYNPNFYFAPDKAYGTKNDLKEFIEEAHKRGIAVINDLVLNHSFNSSPFAKMYWNTETNKPEDLNPWYNADHNFKNTAAHWGVDFNHTSEHTQNLVDKILSFWIEQYHFDGFRFDFTKGFSNTEYPEDSWGSTYDQQRVDLLKRMVGNMWAKHPNKVAIFEHLAEDSEDQVLANFGILMWGGNGITQKFEELAMGWSENLDLSQAYYRNRGFTYSNFMSYMESHDEERLAFKALKYGRDIGDSSIENYREASEAELNVMVPRLKAATTFNLLLPGPRMIWQFGELAYEYSIDYNGRTGKKPARWDYFENEKRKELYHFYANLLNLRNTYSLYQNDQVSDFDISGTSKRITLNGKDKDNVGFQLIAIGNFSDSQAWVTPYFGTDGDWYNYETNEILNVTNHGAYAVSLEAGEYRIYTSKALSKANLYTPVIVSNSDVEINENGSITLSKDWFTIQDADNDASVEYQFNLIDGENYSLSGQTIRVDDYFIGKINVSLKVSDGKFESANYTLPITVNPIKHDLNISVKDAQMIYGESLPEFLVEYTGFVHGHMPTDLSGALSFQLLDGKINASGLSSDHYNITYKPGTLTVNKATPVITKWPTASDITYGETLAVSSLTGGTANVDGTFAFADDSQLLNASTQQVAIIFTPEDADNYTTEEASVSIIINKAYSTISQWPIASEITYGEALAVSSLTDGTANMDGTFAFADASQILVAGTHQVTLSFTPYDADNYNTMEGSISVLINKANSSVSQWPAASEITYRETLGLSSLIGGTANVDGTFAFADDSQLLNAGTHQVDLVFTPEDLANYNTVEGSVAILINKTNSAVSQWPTASDITYGEALSVSPLTGGTANVDGTFAFADASLILVAGTHQVDLVFTPEDLANYNTVEGSVAILINKTNSAVSQWPTISDITYGETLGVSSLTGGTTNVDGTFAFADDSQLLDAGTHQVVLIFTPEEADNYTTAEGNLTIQINKANSTVNQLPIASEITYGNALELSSLTGGIANVNGTFTFSDASQVLNAGSHRVNLIFTPEDVANYKIVEGSITILINKANAAVSQWPIASDITYGETLGLSSLMGGTANVDGTFAFADDSQILDAGINQVAISYKPDNAVNYKTVERTVPVLINKADQEIIWNQEFEALSVNDEIILNAQLKSGLELTYSTDNADIANINKQTLYILASGDFNLLAKNEGNNNYNSIEESIAINVSYLTGIDELNEDKEQLIAYPNPIINELTIQGLRNNESIRLYNASGQIILIDVANGNKKQLHLSNLKAGIYILRTQSGRTLKLLKQ